MIDRSEMPYEPLRNPTYSQDSWSYANFLQGKFFGNYQKNSDFLSYVLWGNDLTLPLSQLLSLTHQNWTKLTLAKPMRLSNWAYIKIGSVTLFLLGRKKLRIWEYILVELRILKVITTLSQCHEAVIVVVEVQVPLGVVYIDTSSIVDLWKGVQRMLQLVPG